METLDRHERKVLEAEIASDGRAQPVNCRYAVFAVKQIAGSIEKDQRCLANAETSRKLLTLR